MLFSASEVSVQANCLIMDVDQAQKNGEGHVLAKQFSSAMTEKMEKFIVFHELLCCYGALDSMSLSTMKEKRYICLSTSV